MRIYIEAINNYPILHEGWICVQACKERGIDFNFFKIIEEVPLNRNSVVIACKIG